MQDLAYLGRLCSISSGLFSEGLVIQLAELKNISIWFWLVQFLVVNETNELPKGRDDHWN